MGLVAQAKKVQRHRSADGGASFLKKTLVFFDGG
jgi:hypothetical protein